MAMNCSNAWPAWRAVRANIGYASALAGRVNLARMRPRDDLASTGFCLAEIPPSSDPLRVMKYYRALWLAYQGLL